MRIIICGSRNFNDYERLKDVCDKIVGEYQWEKALVPSQLEVVSGHARGADKLGERWAKHYGIKTKIFEAEWKNLSVENVLVKSNSYGEYNALAGHNRNQEMLDYALEQDDSIIISFYKGKSKGSKGMIRIAKKAGLKHYVWDDDKGKMRK